MTATDIRDAKFYLCLDAASFERDLRPLYFDEALKQALDLAERGEAVHVMYTDDASQAQLTEFARNGILASLVPQG
jgi:hypothetical protein